MDMNEEIESVMRAIGIQGREFLVMGHLQGKEIAEDDFKMLAAEDRYDDFCDSCCEERPLVALVRSVPDEDVWLDLVCAQCLRRLLGQELWGES